MSKNYTVCSICGKHIEMDESGAAKLYTNYNSNLMWYNSQYFCPECAKKISQYVFDEYMKLKNGNKKEILYD